MSDEEFLKLTLSYHISEYFHTVFPDLAKKIDVDSPIDILQQHMTGVGIDLLGIKKELSAGFRKAPECFMACLARLELATFWFVAKHSIQLSYRHIALSQ